MHIAFDVDGVLYDFVSALRDEVIESELVTEEQRRLAMAHDYRSTTWDFWTQWGMSRQEVHLIVLETGYRLFSSRDHLDMEWVGRTMRNLIDEGHRVDLITREWPGFPGFRQARFDMLMDFPEPKPHGILIAGADQPKTDFAFDLIIEDHHPTAQQAFLARRKAIVFDQPWNREYVDPEWSDFGRAIGAIELERVIRRMNGESAP